MKTFLIVTWSSGLNHYEQQGLWWRGNHLAFLLCLDPWKRGESERGCWNYIIYDARSSLLCTGCLKNISSAIRYKWMYKCLSRTQKCLFKNHDLLPATLGNIFAHETEAIKEMYVCHHLGKIIKMKKLLIAFRQVSVKNLKNKLLWKLMFCART